MSERRYDLTAAQAAFLEAARRATAAGAKPSWRQASVRFPGKLPPVSDQAVRGTCVANAVAALVACYEGCRRRVSVQYLDEVTRLVEQVWVTRNLELISAGKPPERDFEAAFPEAVSQAALLVKANGAGSEAANAFVRALGAKMRARIEADAGCRLKRCFEALEQYGVCREELWPYSPVALNVGAAGGDAVGAFPPGTHEDARRHRIVNGLYVLRAPNNVGEIKGILAGARGRRPMPVCVGLDLFEGRTNGEFSLPDVVSDGGGAHVRERPLGIHEVLLVSSTDDARVPGGGFFTFQNSWGRSWGEEGTGRVSYAYVACFCREAGTILQEPGDYGPGASASTGEEMTTSARRRLTIICAVVICLGAALVSSALAIWSWHSASARPAARPPSPPPAPHAVAVAEPDLQSPSAADGDDGTFAVERIVDYRYRMRGACSSASGVDRMVKALRGKHQEFSAEIVDVSDEEQTFECEVTIEGLVGRPPHAIQVIDGYLERKSIESAVRKWSVRRLR